MTLIVLRNVIIDIFQKLKIFHEEKGDFELSSQALGNPWIKYSAEDLCLNLESGRLNKSLKEIFVKLCNIME